MLATAVPAAKASSTKLRLLMVGDAKEYVELFQWAQSLRD
jgi:hypothetical protein